MYSYFSRTTWPVFKLVKLVQDKPGTMPDSPNSHNEQRVVGGVDETGADFGAENSLLVELKDIKRSLLILEKQVEANTRSLLINPQKKYHITNEEFFTQKERCESLQATLCNKVEEANEMKIKIASLETRAALACSRLRDCWAR